VPKSGVVPAATHVLLGELMVSVGLITPEQLREALRIQAEEGAPLGRILIAHNYASAAAVANALAHQHGGLVRTEYGVAAGELPPPPLLQAPEPAVTSPAPPTAAPGRLRVRLAAADHKPGFLDYCHRLGARVEDLGDVVVEVWFEADADDELEPYLVSWSERNGIELELVRDVEPAPESAADPAAAAPAPPAAPEPAAEMSAAPRFERAAPRGIRLGDLLVTKGFISRDQLAFALLMTQTTGQLLGRVLLEQQWIFEDELARCLSEQWKLRFVNLGNVGVDRGAVRLLPRNVGLQFSAIPVRHAGDGVDVAFVDPTDDRALEAVDFFVRPFNPVVATLSDIMRMWRKVGEPDLVGAG
jgi:hypothetical protein